MVGKLIFNLLGIVAATFGISRDTLSLRAALKRCKLRGEQVASIIDVGASDGRWSLSARKYMPQAFCLLIEAQEAHKEALERVKSRNSNFDYVLAAAGDENGNIFFDADDLFGGVASTTPMGMHCVTVPMITIDEEVSRRNLPPPYLLKLDTHGFEIPILNGAMHTLALSSLVIIETYNFRLTADSLKFHEMCSFLESKGFSCIDLIEPMHRPSDKALWQMDLVFIPSSSSIFSSNSYLSHEKSK